MINLINNKICVMYINFYRIKYDQVKYQMLVSVFLTIICDNNVT